MIERIQNSAIPMLEPNKTPFSVSSNSVIASDEEVVDIGTKESHIEQNQMLADLSHIQTSMRFQKHEQLDEYYLVVIDQETNEVLKEIPTKELLDISAARKQFLGLFFDLKI